MYYLLCVVIWVVTIAVVHYSYLQPVSAELQLKKCYDIAEMAYYGLVGIPREK